MYFVKQKHIIGIYLAAGKSSRMGHNKLYLPFGEMKLGNHALSAALDSALDHTVIVTTEEDPLSWLDPVLLTEEKKRKWTRASCRHAVDGQAYSIKCGLEKAIMLGADAVVIMLADQPLLHVGMINDLIFHFRKNDSLEYVASGFADRLQPPVLFSESLFPVLRQLDGDTGARAVLRKQPSASGKTIMYTDGKGFYDIDTEEDYKWVKNQMEY